MKTTNKLNHILLHIPHSSTYLPQSFFKNFNHNVDLDFLINKFTDLKTDELYIRDNIEYVLFKYSRLYCDVERFISDKEIMNKLGQGFIYTKTSYNGINIHNSISNDYITEVLNIYKQHHQNLCSKYNEFILKNHDFILLDCHSFSNALAREVLEGLNQINNSKIIIRNMPDICIGFNEDEYSKHIGCLIKDIFIKYGYKVDINYPYSGAIIPNNYNSNVKLNIAFVMIEINKNVYLNDIKKFNKMKKILDEIYLFLENTFKK